MDAIKKFSTVQAENKDVLMMLNSFWEKHWNIIAAMLSENMGANIFGSIRRGEFEFLVNDTELPFITSDRPVNNIHADEIGKSAAPEFIDLYYPLSPRVAFHMPESFAGSKVVRGVDSQEVDALNREVAKASFGTIVSTTKETIDIYKKMVPLPK
jgi:hypothetical protein